MIATQIFKDQSYLLLIKRNAASSSKRGSMTALATGGNRGAGQHIFLFWNRKGRMLLARSPETARVLIITQIW